MRFGQEAKAVGKAFGVSLRLTLFRFTVLVANPTGGIREISGFGFNLHDDPHTRVMAELEIDTTTHD